MYTMADIQRAVQQGPWDQNAGPGFNTPLQPEPMQYVGPPTHNEPPERRQGGPLLSESLLQSLLTSCTLSNNMRPASANIFRPQYMRTVFQVSSLGAQGASPSGHSLPITAPTPLDPVQPVSDAIRLAAEARSQARAQQQQVQSQVPQPPAVPLTPTTPVPTERRAYEVPIEPQATDEERPTHEDSSPSYDVIPHIYEGDERSCSLCLEEFVHGQRVCRVTCRHMYHASCWEILMTSAAHRD